MPKQPSRDDPSKPKEHGYAYKKQFYQSSEVAADYDEHRFRTPKRMRRNARKWNAIQKALAMAEGTKTVIDLPCGTGRFTGHLARAGYQVVGSDISIEMMHQAAKLLSQGNIAGYVRADAEALPFQVQVRGLPDVAFVSCSTSIPIRAGACCANSAACRVAG